MIVTHAFSILGLVLIRHVCMMGVSSNFKLSWDSVSSLLVYSHPILTL